MKAVDKKYHLEIQKHRKNPCGVLRTSYIENGKVRHENLFRFSGLSLGQLEVIRLALQNKDIDSHTGYNKTRRMK